VPPEAFNFDAVVDRRDGDSTKWNEYRGRDILPLWVADMDFAAPLSVRDALHRRVEHGVFGYGQPWPSLVEAVQAHLLHEYAWAVKPEWLVWLPGLVSGLELACRTVGEAGDAVCTATPIYPPFLHAPGHSGRQVVTVALQQGAQGWQWDFDALDHTLRESGARLLLLCHPHNPVGHVWREAELRQLAALVERYDLIVCSDEVHCDLILDPTLEHRPFATLSQEISKRCITLMAPSKTFNLPGLGCAFAVIPDARLRRDFRTVMQGILPHVNTLGLVACEAALRTGGAWRNALLDYLRSNARYVETAIAAMPGLSMHPVEATYLAWIDARSLGVDNPQRVFESAGVGLSDGADFGAPGFVRLNFGCPHTTLDEALGRMRNAVGRLREGNA
jgi:cystathionine beta-lyase